MLHAGDDDGARVNHHREHRDHRGLCALRDLCGEDRLLWQRGDQFPVLRLVERARGPRADVSGGTERQSELRGRLVIGQISDNHDVVFAKRTDESFVYAVSTNDFARLPTAMWQLRDRKLCRFSQADVTGLTLRRGAQVCRLIHKGPLSWSFAPGSQGIINDAAIEETVRGVVQVSAWLPLNSNSG